MEVGWMSQGGWAESRCVLKTEPTSYANGLSVGWRGKGGSRRTPGLFSGTIMGKISGEASVCDVCVCVGGTLLRSVY
jgi:hypothetical protein